jgi:hypothetical protein
MKYVCPITTACKKALSWNLNLFEAYLKMYRKHTVPSVTSPVG